HDAPRARPRRASLALDRLLPSPLSRISLPGHDPARPERAPDRAPRAAGADPGQPESLHLDARGVEAARARSRFPRRAVVASFLRSVPGHGGAGRAMRARATGPDLPLPQRGPP